ncbi:unnamed protein product [Rhizoctonia solani]|uniref:Secreted protein n=1 Tax=Rhizoctonia solani TaxID=456999 RepID=A0A8H3BFE1_9AGAM|nr:unnamed protein product [Rhizoctonia solani]
MHGLKISAIIAACASMVVAVPTYKNNNSCDRDSFWYAPKSVCLPHGTKDKCNPPEDRECGKWYWNKNLNYCAPSSPSYGDAQCSDGWKWDDGEYSCVRTYSRPSPPPGQCHRNHFWWKTKSVCLPDGGDPKPSQPPNGDRCPKKWYYHSQGYCAPPKSNHGDPDCEKNYNWDNDSLCCKAKRY